MGTAAQWRKRALSMPEAEETSHFGKPDFRVHEQDAWSSVAPRRWAGRDRVLGP